MARATALLGAACAVALAGCGSSDDGGSSTAAGDGGGAASKTRELVVTSYGGDFERAQKKALFDRFEQETGVRVKLVTMYSADALAKLTAARGNSGIDVVQFSGGQEVQAGDDGLIARIDPADLENVDDVHEKALHEGFAPAFAFDTTGIIYRSDVKQPPTGWASLSDPQYKGRVALPDINTTFAVQTLLKLASLNGGSQDDVKPGFEALGKVVDNSHSVFRDAPTMVQLLSGDEADMAVYDSGYGFLMHQQGIPVDFKIPDEGSYLTKLTMNVVEGSENQEMARKLIDMALDADVQQSFADDAGYGPTNVTARVTGPAARFVATPEQVDELESLDEAFVAKNRPAWTAEWNRTIAK
ncbi:putative spermidine/putrescine transport system substrate-binding protein [Conexibacter arvalis]|uniref:Putative spermidine/putrescine transport system substrate-binding protein n=1 Tax=Conexibacter arvalis TaxID=912552 RepID=A0A840I6N3_9ACTN|nr:putative spermidine/putrescine transport system substrate-binding protein [Conexibacter arvalis]